MEEVHRTQRTANNKGPKGSTQAALEEQQRWPVWDTQWARGELQTEWGGVEGR